MADQHTNGNGIQSNAMVQPAKWTIMVYMAADAVLAGFAIESLKQLRATAGHGVVVTVQFDAPERAVRRLVFNGGDKTGSINDHRPKHTKDLAPGTNMADPKTLAEFIGWAHKEQPYSDHYALVLWGHGPELLLDDYVVPGTKRTQKSFLTPVQLREGLRLAKAQGGPTFDVLAADACSTSNLEIVCELQEYATYLIASQEDVPDFSFPYGQFIPDFQRTNDVAQICKAIPGLYIEAYQDFIRNNETTMKPVTLTSLALDQTHVSTVTGPLAELTEILLNSVNDPKIRRAVIEARAEARSFVSGLYVDLYDFCQKLSPLVVNGCENHNLRLACEDVRRAMDQRNGRACILENRFSEDPTSHGLSIYFPYQDPDQAVGPLAPLIKGSSPDVPNKGASSDVLNKNSLLVALNDGSSTNGLTKGSSPDVPNKGSSPDVLNKAGADMLRRIRLQQIQETEGYYSTLMLAKLTRWDQFIVQCWSRWLAEGTLAVQRAYPTLDASDILDQHYSAQQCALNLLSYRPKPPKSDAPQGPASTKVSAFG